MISNETGFFLALLPIFAGFAIVLFKMIDSKQDKLDEDVASTYAHLRKHTLDPILREIIEVKRGKYKPNEFFNAPEVAINLSEYREKLFKFNKVSEMKGNILLMLELSLKTTVGIVLMIIVFITINEIFINSVYNTFGISILHTIILDSIILATLTIFLVIFVRKFISTNTSFKAQITELKGGLP